MAEVVVQEIETEEQYDAIVDASQTQVVIVDLYQQWCGPCTAMKPAFKKILLEYENASERIVFASCKYENIIKKVQSTFPSDTAVHLERHGCLPLFAIYRFGANIGLLPGVDGPAILGLIDINIPPIKDDY
jgi:thiol-disulfide isomerase/thioredoxin